MANNISNVAHHMRTNVGAILVFLLLFLHPLLTMAMKKGEGLRKGDAHGVPGKTMLNGDRPVPLQPGVNSAPKVQSILNTESSRKGQKVQSLLAGPIDDNKIPKKRVESLLGPSSSSKATGKGNATEYLAIGKKAPVNSLLMDPSFNAVPMPTNKAAAATEYMAMPKDLFAKMAKSIQDIYDQYVPAQNVVDQAALPPRSNKLINLADIADAPIVATFLFAISNFLQAKKINPYEPFKSPTLNLELVMDKGSRQLFVSILATARVDSRIRTMVSDIFSQRVTEQPTPALQSRLTCHWLTFMLQELIKGLNKNGGNAMAGGVLMHSNLRIDMDVVKQRMDDVNEDNKKHLKKDERNGIKTSMLKIKKDMTKTMIMDDADVVERSGAGNKDKKVRFAPSLLIMGQEEQVPNAGKGKLAESLLAHGSSNKGKGMNAWVAEKTRKMKEKQMDNF